MLTPSSSGQDSRFSFLQHGFESRWGHQTIIMKILILDIYPNKPYRISKDNNGGYGSANKYGTNLISKAINWFVKKNVDWPPLSCVHVAGILREKNHQVKYMRTLPENLDNYELFIVTSSIVGCETEINTIKELNKLNKKVAVIGPLLAPIQNYI